MAKQIRSSKLPAVHRGTAPGRTRDPRRRCGLLLTAGLLLLPIAAALHPLQVQAQTGDAEIAQGKQLFTTHKCTLCHSIGGAGGSVGPALDEVGKKWTPEKLAAFLREPSTATAMPPMDGTPEEFQAVAAYLMSLGGPPATPAPAATTAAAPAPTAAEGQQFFAAMHCFYCHQIDGKGGTLGPALDREDGSKRSQAFVISHLENPAATNPDSVMPVVRASQEEVQALALYIESLKPGAALPAIALPPPAQGNQTASIAEGESLYRTASCDNCHAIGSKGALVGPELDNEGNSGRTLDWLLSYFQKPDQVVPGTLMPVVQGTDQQLHSLALYLLSLKTEIPATASLGRTLYAERNCGYCHGEDAKGKKIGPALAGAKGPVPSDDWFLQHFEDPAAATPNSAMPRTWVARWESQSLLAYLKTLRGS